jgi:hypothetical protein
MEPLTNRSKRKHTSQSSDPPPKTKEVAQSYLTAHTSCPGQQKPSTVLSSTFLTSERLTPSGGPISTGNRTHRPPSAASLHSLQEAKSMEPPGGKASTGKRVRELSTSPTQTLKKSQPPVWPSYTTSTGKRARELSTTTTQSLKRIKLIASPDGIITGRLPRPFAFSQDPDIYPDSKDNP